MRVTKYGIMDPPDNVAKSKAGNFVGARKKQPLIAIIALLVVGVVINVISSGRSMNLVRQQLEVMDPGNETVLNTQKISKSHNTSSNQTSKRQHSHVGDWLSCLKSIQTTQFDILESIFTDPALTGPHKPILFIDPSNHGNFGDTLLAQGVYEFLARFGYGKRNLEVCRVHQAHAQTPECGDFRQFSNEGIKLAVWHPGGNWGDLWNAVHQNRMRTFRDLLKNNFTVVGFPQSLHFGNLKNLDNDVALLRQMIKESGVSMEVAKERIILTWRQQNSYDTAMDNYGFVQNLLVPDIAFQVGPLLDQDRYPTSLMNDYDMQKKDIVFVMRNDKESIYSKFRNGEVIRKMLNTLPGGENLTFVLDDWPMLGHPNKYYQRVDAAVRLKTKTDLDFDFMEHEAMSYMSLGKVLITDRLHASILGFLAYKPHVMLENSYKKISLTRNVAFNSSEVCRDKSLMRYDAASGFHDALEKAIAMLDNFF